METSTGSKIRGVSLRNLSTSVNVDKFKDSFNRILHFTLGKSRNDSTKKDYFFAVSLLVKELLLERCVRTHLIQQESEKKSIYFLSMEYLPGTLLRSALLNLSILELCETALSQLGIDLDDISHEENDIGIGSGGLGRLSSCFLESMTSLGIFATGYGLRYNLGYFKQKIINSEQVEEPDDWLASGNPWELSRPDDVQKIEFYGKVVRSSAEFKWIETQVVLAIPYDYPIPGYENNYVNTMRLWAAKSENSNFRFYNNNQYINAALRAGLGENITRVLYPSDSFNLGKELRLQQEFFLVSATLQDIVKRYKTSKFGTRKAVRNTFEQFPQKVSIQLNDTHPSLAIPELMRILIDIERLSWTEAWTITVKTFSYTNHTVLPEALERWPTTMLENILPRHLQIIYEINHRFLEEVRGRWRDDDDRVRRMSFIEEGEVKIVNMSHLAIVGSHTVNGVSFIHSELLKKDVFKDFYELYPEKFHNKTNGVNPRRWLLSCNPLLAKAITERIGEKWITDLEELKKLKYFIQDHGFIKTIMKIKDRNKSVLVDFIKENFKIIVDPYSIFDVHIKRIHEYKRQILNCLHIIYMYNKIKKNPNDNFVPRTVIIGGKAAPGYAMAKDIIRLICGIAKVVNNDPEIGRKLKVIFLENYSVTLAEMIIPAADLSEQISTAGTEASGTGNMKLMMNGSLTIGTLDGANIEIREEAGDENIFIFGMTVEKVKEIKCYGYDALSYYNRIYDLKIAIDQIKNGYFSNENPNRFNNLCNMLMKNDAYLVFADYEDYIQCQERVSEVFTNRKKWAEMAVINIASSGKFSSDRAIYQYATEIWNVQPTLDKLPDPGVSRYQI